MLNRPVCFVLMPFGVKKDPAGGPDIDFDRIYEDAIRPGIESAGLEPIRADEERTGGIIHRAMFERLLLCDFAVADLTTANANVFYELGVRHAVRPATTLAIFAKQQSLPFDVNYLRALPYDLAAGNQFGPSEARGLSSAISRRLDELRSVASGSDESDSPLFQLLPDFPAPDISRLKTDLFRERLELATGIKRDLAAARDRRDGAALQAMAESLSMEDTEAGVLVDLYLSFRALAMWDDMVALYGRFPKTLQRAVMVREQLGLAQNRAGDRKAAIRTLEEVLQEHGASSETCGILGRVYKDLWSEARDAGDTALAEGYLAKAIETYTRGFEADWRDAYPGINAVTLLDIQGDAARRDEMLPVVRYSAKQRIGTRPDYWDLATMLELAVLGGNEAEARDRLRGALVAVREHWEPATTANNLELIREARSARGENQPWLDEIIAALRQRAS